MPSENEVVPTKPQTAVACCARRWREAWENRVETEVRDVNDRVPATRGHRP